MYEIERKNLKPLGKISFPDIDSFTEDLWDKMVITSEKYDFDGEKKKGVVSYDFAKLNAKSAADFVGECGKWDFGDFSLEQFNELFDSKEKQLPTNFVFWLSANYTHYINRVIDPNDYAAS